MSIIEEILSFARVDAGKEEEVHRETLDAVTLTRDVEELFEPQARAKGLSLTVTLPEHDVILSTDATKLRQILISLVGNTLKFTDAGQVNLAMSLSGDEMHF